MKEPSRVTTHGIDHVHLNVYQLEKAIELFTSLFQCKHNHPLLIDSVDGINSMNSIGMDCFAPASEDGIWGKMLAMQQAQAADHEGQAYVESQPGAVKTGGLHHVRLRVKSVEDLELAIAKFESWFECTWERGQDGRSATSSLDVHLLVSKSGAQGIGAFAMAVPDLDAANQRVEELGLTQIQAPRYLLDSEQAICLAPEHCFGLSMILVESDSVREDRHH